MISQKWIEPAGVLAFTAGLLLLSIAMFIISQIAKPQMILGALMFGIAAVLISFGIGMFADSFGMFNAIDFEKTLAGLGIVLLIMAAVFGLGALLSNPVALALFTVGVVGILALGIAFTILGAGLMVLSSGLTGLTEFVKTLSDFSKVAESGAIITKTITDLSDAIASIPESKDVTLNALTNTLSVAKSITEEEVKPTKEFLNAAKEFYVAQENVGALVAATGMILAAVTQMTSALTSKNKADDEPKMFKLVLNDGQTLTGKAYGTQNLSKKILGEG